MKLKYSKVILASGSPRRRELLAGLGIDFEVDTKNNFKEYFDPSTKPGLIPSIMSEGKSHGFHRPLEKGELLITSDTVVIIDGKVLGKPHSREEAHAMLRTLSGRTHKVVTAVTLRDATHEKSFADETLVTFAEMSDSEISYYIDTCKPFDKAGAYGVQEWLGYATISRIEGSFYTVMGFPTHRVWQELSTFQPAD